MDKDCPIKLYPYLSHSKKLMEFFIVIGYKEENIIENCPNIKENFENLELSILSVYATNLAINYIDLNYIIKNTYPNKPNLIEIEGPEIKPKISSVVFFTCFNSGEDGKVFYSCYGLRFYERFKDNFDNKEYYVPKAFLIISEYPYFTTFHKICKNIYMTKIEEKENELLKIKSKNKKTEFYEQDKIPMEIFIHCIVNYVPSPKDNNIIYKLFNNEEYNFEIPKINGYPHIDYDLCHIFNIISINEFLKLFILIFSEVSLLIFSEDITKLSIIMYSLYVLNYPLIDGSYLRNLKIFPKNENGYFLEISDTFYGINTQFYSNYKFTNEMHVLFDLDNNKFYNSKLPYDESKQIKNLLEYIKKIFNNKKQNKSSFLLEHLSSLKSKLENIINKYNRETSNFSKRIFFMDKSINSFNIEIQEAFYDFILNIIIILNKDFQINDSCTSIERKTREKKDKDKLSADEFFIKKLTESDKYNLYYNNFITEFIHIDVFRIPLLLFDEFAQQRRYNPDKISYFKIIEYFYATKDNNLVDYIDFCAKNPDKITFDYNTIFKEYKHLNNDLIEKTKKTSINYQLFYLDKNKISTLLYYIKNNKNVFKNIKEMEKKVITIESVDRKSIFKIIQNSFSFSETLKQNYFIKASLVYVFSMVFPLFSPEKISESLSNLLTSINNMQFFQRNYLYIILRSINKYYLINKEKKYFPELNYENVRNYCQKIKQYLNDCSILPNEETFLYLKELLNNNNENINDNYNNNEENNDNRNFIFKYDKTVDYINYPKYKNIIEKDDEFLFFRYDGKLNEYYFFEYNLIFLQADSTYNYYLSRENFNIINLSIDNIIKIIVNLMYYLLLPNFNDRDMVSFLFKSLYLLNKLKKDLIEYKEKKG